ncbi:MBL fold metallo-hydrolase [Alicyclobacillaceae bacterium I2511]|nr:MBL fold metallo-hydrolase [Alicyclobacillaceae bacterium I2511]
MQVKRIELPTPLPVGMVNAYYVEQGETRFLVDCGPRYQPAQETLLQELKGLGLTPSHLNGLVLTHGHVDHAGLASLFQTAGVPIFAHPQTESWLQPGGAWDKYRRDFLRTLYQQMGVPESEIQKTEKEFFFLENLTGRSVVDIPLIDGHPFPLLPELRVVYVPGHAQAAIALWDEKTGDFIVGDQLLPDISANAFIEPLPGALQGRDAQRSKSLLQYRENLQLLHTLPLTHVYPGHGGIFTNSALLIERRLSGQEHRRNQLLQRLRERPRTAFELAIDYFSRHRQETSLIISEVLGYLDWMEELGEVVPEKRGGLIQWCQVECA